jgi:hypothetical protein
MQEGQESKVGEDDVESKGGEEGIGGERDEGDEN